MFLRLLSYIYLKVINYRNKKFDKQTDLIKCKVPVISVGNLTAGGSGKTPFVIMLAEEIIRMGKIPVIIGRGYKKKKKGEAYVSDGKTIFLEPGEAGDEMYLLASRLNVPVIANEKKYLAALKAEQLANTDVIIVDDGFQHRKLFRDMNIVLIDEGTISNPKLLPAGRLREPLTSLKRADVVCLTSLNIDKSTIVKYLNNKCFVIRTNVVYSEPYSIYNDDKIKKDFPIIAVSGIARPERFFKSLNGLGFRLTEEIKFRDHHDYSEDDITGILMKPAVKECRQIITTEKDAVKLKKYNKLFANSNINCYVLPINNIIIENKDLFIEKIKKLFNNL